jgi:hypothetical protein
MLVLRRLHPSRHLLERINVSMASRAKGELEGLIATFSRQGISRLNPC